VLLVLRRPSCVVHRWVALIRLRVAHLVGTEALRRHRRVVAAASPRHAGVAVHQLATVDRAHHEPIDLAVDEYMGPIQLVLMWAVHGRASVLLGTTVCRLLHMRVAVRATVVEELVAVVWWLRWLSLLADEACLPLEGLRQALWLSGHERLQLLHFQHWIVLQVKLTLRRRGKRGPARLLRHVVGHVGMTLLSLDLLAKRSILDLRLLVFREGLAHLCRK